MKVGVVKETFPGELRVALIPDSVAALAKIGLRAFTQRVPGLPAGSTDGASAARGADLPAGGAEVFAAADAIVQVRALGANLEAGVADLGAIRSGQTVIGFFEPLTSLAAA